MRLKIAFLLAGTIWLIGGCSALQGRVSPSLPVEVVSSPTQSGYIAPTLPPVYTKTPTPTPLPTQPPSPTPFTIVTVESGTPGADETTSIPTPAFTFTNWEQYEADRFNFAIELPDTLQATVFGQNLVIASPSNAEVPIPLNIEMRVDADDSFRLPEGINPADPRSVLEGVLNEFETEYNRTTMVRPVANISVRGKPAAEAAARTTTGAGESTQETLWYLAVIVNEQNVVRVYASSPAETGGAYLAIAERITDSLEFLPEP
jgi:hypothetical protein